MIAKTPEQWTLSGPTGWTGYMLMWFIQHIIDFLEVKVKYLSHLFKADKYHFLLFERTITLSYHIFKMEKQILEKHTTHGSQKIIMRRRIIQKKFLVLLNQFKSSLYHNKKLCYETAYSFFINDLFGFLSNLCTD